MKTLTSTLVLASFFLAMPVMAGSGHDHGHDDTPKPVTQETVETVKPLQQNIDTKQPQQAQWKDTITVTVPAKGDKEYKLQLTKGASFEYAWKTDKGALFFDFHGEPKGDTTGYFKTFKKDTKSSANGSLTTEFEGTHGWYWKNNTSLPVVVTLNVKGEYKRLDIEVNQETAEKNAQAIISSLIGKGKIDKSWESVKASSIEKKEADGRSEWLVLFNNEKAPSTDKQKLYVFLTIAGEYIAANYTGK